MLVLFFARRLNIQRLKRQIKEMEQNGGTSEEASKEIAQMKQEIDSIKLSKDQLQKVDFSDGHILLQTKNLYMCNKIGFYRRCSRKRSTSKRTSTNPKWNSRFFIESNANHYGFPISYS